MNPSILIAGQIPSKTRSLLLMVFDGEKRSLPWLHMLYKLDFYRMDDILAWLVKNRITGSEFVAFVEEGHHKSILWMVSYILKELNRDLVTKPILVGRDVK